MIDRWGVYLWLLTHLSGPVPFAAGFLVAVVLYLVARFAWDTLMRYRAPRS